MHDGGDEDEMEVKEKNGSETAEDQDVTQTEDSCETTLQRKMCPASAYMLFISLVFCMNKW